MPVPHVSENFADVLDPRFHRIVDDAFNELPDMIPTLYGMDGSNNRDTIRWSQVGTLPNFSQFSGSVDYKSQNQGFDTIATFLEFAQGVQIRRTLFDDDQFSIMDQRPRALGRAAFRTRQTHGARMWNNGFSVDNFFYNNTEAVALFSNSHTTTSGASTATGFDNLGTSALSAAAVASARIQMVDFRGDQAERISVVPTELLHPPNLYEEAFEITQALGKLDTAENNPNVHMGKYNTIEWNYLVDNNNWFMHDDTMRKESVRWADRVALEFGMIEDFDTLIAKWRGYMRYANAHIDWRWGFGSQVS